MSSQEPTPAGTPRAVFGAMLRYYRLKAGLTQDQLGTLAHVSGKTIAAYENGWRVPTRQTTADVDGVAELNTNGALSQLWEQFEDGMTYQAYPDWFQDWPEKEARARRLRWYEPNLVPGLLQTEDYARAVFRTRFGITAEAVEERVAGRLRRQEVLARDSPPSLWVIVDEWALRRPVGGPPVMLDQVNQLIEAARQPTIVIEVISAAVGAHTGLNGGGFAIADFEEEPSVGYQEGQLRGQPVRERKDVESLDLTWDTLRCEAESRAASLALLEEAAKSWTSAT
ncbi:MAG TPA: helix-turn-helix transcriptional regulator [Streptosporangiaceae bacterium]|nr:helix-turn-helix transcriptional regulator [Streptosporangiaceae bacterium]